MTVLTMMHLRLWCQYKEGSVSPETMLDEYKADFLFNLRKLGLTEDMQQ